MFTLLFLLISLAYCSLLEKDIFNVNPVRNGQYQVVNDPLHGYKCIKNRCKNRCNPCRKRCFITKSVTCTCTCTTESFVFTTTCDPPVTVLETTTFTATTSTSLTTSITERIARTENKTVSKSVTIIETDRPITSTVTTRHNTCKNKPRKTCTIFCTKTVRCVKTITKCPGQGKCEGLTTDPAIYNAVFLADGYDKKNKIKYGVKVHPKIGKFEQYIYDYINDLYYTVITDRATGLSVCERKKDDKNKTKKRIK